MIRYLKQGEKSGSRPLWEEAFPEDSPAFVDFYYGEKAGKNRILVAEETGTIVAMLHRVPYDVVARDRIWKIDYVAGVATLPAWRHKGYMKSLLLKMFVDMYTGRMEFCFLVPADPDIYAPFDFTYISDLPETAVLESGKPRLDRRSCIEQMGDCAEASSFASRRLEKEYEVYVKRDEEYYRSLCREVRSADGDLILLRTVDERQRLAGVYAYYGGEEPEQRELICLPDCCKIKGVPKPAVMGRIICLEQFVKVIRLSEDSPVSRMELLIEVVDPYIRQNSGIFTWRLDRDGSELIPAPEYTPLKPHLSLSIAEMTAWLFGYRVPEVPGDRRAAVERIRTLRGVFFDEIV